MAAKAKKGKKKGITLNLTDFLADEQGNVAGPGSSYVLANKSVDWAAEMEELDGSTDPGYGQHAVDRTKLPTAPKSSRGPEDMERVPKDPPFTAFIGNLPYEVSEEMIADFFNQLPVVNVRLPEDSGRFRGFGYVQFETRLALIDALNMNEESLGGRKVRIDLAGQSQHGGSERDGRSGGGGRDDGQPDRTEGDWRSSAPKSGADDRGPSRDDRGGPRGFDRDERGPSRGFDRDDRGPSRGFDRDDRGPSRGFEDRGGSRGFEDRDRGGGFSRRDDGGGFGRDRNDDRDGGRRGFGSGFRRDDDRSGGGFDSFDRDKGGDRGSFGGDRGGDRGFGGDRGGDRGYGGDRGGDRGFGGDRGGDRGFGGDRGGDRGFGGDRGGDRDRYGYNRGGYERPERQEPRETETPKERPRLQLAPRSKPVENNTAPVAEKPVVKPASKAASIFGSAKPVNTAQRELEIEERLRKQKLDPPAPTKSSLESRYGSSRGGYEDPKGYDEPRDTGRERRYEENTETRTTHKPDRGSRPRSDSDKSQEGDGHRERRHSSGSSNKGRKGPSRPRKNSGEPGSQSEVLSGGEDHHREDKSYNAVSLAHTEEPQKLVPAPPPKENIWEKRKVIQTPPKSASDEPKSPPPRESQRTDTSPQSTRSPPVSQTHNQSSRQPQAQQHARPTSQSENTQSQPKSPNQPKTDGKPKEFVPAEPPKENPWMKRKQEQEVKALPRQEDESSDISENSTGPAPGLAPVHNTGAPNAWAGRGGASGDRGRGRGGRGGMGRGRGGDIKPKSEKRERPLPQSVDEMPKYEEKTKQDFSDSNKFAGLIDDDEEFEEES